MGCMDPDPPKVLARQLGDLTKMTVGVAERPSSLALLFTDLFTACSGPLRMCVRHEMHAFSSLAMLLFQ